MGVGAAMIMPVTLSVITTVFPPEERGKAVGTWVGVAAGGGVLGLLASGVLLEWLPWQSIFVLNVVLAAVALVGTLAIVPATRETRPPRLDPSARSSRPPLSQRSSSASSKAPSAAGAKPMTVASLALGVVGVVAFVLWELRRREPMLDPRHFAPARLRAPDRSRSPSSSSPPSASSSWRSRTSSS